MKELTKKQIVEGNKLIYNFTSNDILPNDFIAETVYTYHNRYDLIMPAWVKICEIIKNIHAILKFISISNDFVHIELYKKESNSCVKKIFISGYKLKEYDLNSALFLTIVDFIKWYNENKEVVK